MDRKNDKLENRRIKIAIQTVTSLLNAESIETVPIGTCTVYRGVGGTQRPLPVGSKVRVPERHSK